MKVASGKLPGSHVVYAFCVACNVDLATMKVDMPHSKTRQLKRKKTITRTSNRKSS